MITVFFFFVSFFLIGLLGYFFWNLHERMEIVVALYDSLARKVRDGEDVIIKNFETVEKKFTRVANEIKNTQRVKPKNQDAIKAARIARRQEP